MRAGEAIDLKIDEAGRDEGRIFRRPNQMIDHRDGAIEGNFDGCAGGDIDPDYIFAGRRFMHKFPTGTQL